MLNNIFQFTSVLLTVTVCVSVSATATADEPALLKTHCSNCHSGDEPEGEFALQMLGDGVDEDSRDLWVASYEYVKSGEMPPADESEITNEQRAEIAEYLRRKLLAFDKSESDADELVPRRLNNREFANSVASVLMIEDVGTHQPLGSLLGDTLHDGFDTHGDSLGISEYHLEQYIEACRKVVDAVVLSGAQPKSRRYEVTSDQLKMSSLSQNMKRAGRGLRGADCLEFGDPALHIYFDNFQSVSATGRYKIKIRATGVDHGLYDSEATGIYDGDPIQLQVRLGDRHYTYDLPDNKVLDIELNEWLARGTKIELYYPTDGFRLIGNGNFKFQNSISHDYFKENDPEFYAKAVAAIAPTKRGRGAKSPRAWQNWVKYWRGPRPRVFDAVVEGPFYESWPPKRHVSLIGKAPKVENAEEILRPIAERAWRREVRDGELDTIVQMVKLLEAELGDVGALKEGIVALFLTPSFLLINSEEGTPADRFASKMAFFLSSRPPAKRVRDAVAAGNFDQFEAVNELTQWYFRNGEADAFLSEFPKAWLELDRINFMAPDPDQYRHYHKKQVSDDMIKEAVIFFQDGVEKNIPIPEMLTADYSFINADLAQIYGIDHVPQDSVFRKHVFGDGRRGGLLGMGSFLTLTADSLGTSPIHRGVYVLENFLGTTPSPPPGDIEIPEPDVRSATTIKEVLQAHVSNETCKSCHQSIDPYGYAFENFDPAGGWRDSYVQKVDPAQSEKEAETRKQGKKRKSRKAEPIEIPIDSSAEFRNGETYKDIIEFRKLMKSAANQERFVRCFISKLLLYANGEEPEDFAELEKILAKSAEHDYQIVETIAAVVDSPLFREQ